jgi:hypothetical protein
MLYSFLQEDYTKDDFKNDLKSGIKKTIKGIGYVMTKTGDAIQKKSKPVSKAIQKGTEKTLDYTGKGISYLGNKMNNKDKQ